MKQKNLLYIFADQWRWHATGFAKQDGVCTPNMDAFALNSLRLNNAISTYPLCSPHRAALLTGKYPMQCGMWTNCKIGLPEVMLNPQEICISDVLHDNGYRTGYVGKWHLDASELNFSDNPKSGAVNWDAFTPKGERRHGFEYWYSYGAMDNHTSPHYWSDTPEKIEPKKWSPINETDVALDFLKTKDDRPFCLYLSWNPPHPPYDLIPEEVLAPWLDREIKFRDNVPEDMKKDESYLLSCRQYFAAIEGLDVQFGRLIEYLKASGLYEDTVIVLSADHGDCMGSHGLYGKNIWYEESIRIPLVIGGAGIKGGTSDCLVASADHAPTLLSLLNQKIPSSMQGLDISPIINNETFEQPQEAFLCMVTGTPSVVRDYVRQGLNSKCFGWRGLRTKTHTFIVDNKIEPNEKQIRYLYDNIADPYQLSPMILTADSPENKYYEDRLRQWLDRFGDDFLLDRID